MPAPVRIEFGPGKSVTITVPTIKREDLIGIISRFFAGENDISEKELRKIFTENIGDVTMVLTTKL